MYNFQAEILESYDIIVRLIRRTSVPKPDKELLKSVANHLQVEKHARKTKVYKVLTAPIQEAETFQKEKSREPPAQKQQAPIQVTSAVKYKAPELTASVLKFPCEQIDFMDWKDNMLRWLKGANTS